MAHDAPLSPLAPPSYPDLPQIDGVSFAAGEGGIRYKGRTDVMMALMNEGTTVAGVFTRSKCPSAPVDWCRKNLSGGAARVLVVNSGNANAFTGAKGVASVELTAEIAAKATSAKASEIFLASTGVIGEPLDAHKFNGILDDLAATAKIDGISVTINGMAKGAGMIAPDMATMLSFIFTDAPLAAPALQAMLSKGVQGSFNSITVDSDTSTSDTLMLFATGTAQKRGCPQISSASDPRLNSFKKALNRVLLNLAHQVVRDGEGARKFIEIQVEGASSAAAAKKIGLSIANSPLVKTAIAGEDANWGRVVMAVGKAGEKAERDKLSIFFGGMRVAHLGLRDPSYDETVISNYMRGDHIVLKVELGIGRGKASVWTCDLTKDYVAINGDYRS